LEIVAAIRAAGLETLRRTSVKRTVIAIAGCEIEVQEEGSGAPLLFLHAANGFRPNDPYIAALSAGRRLICPSHPGFGTSSLPGWIDSVDDIAHIYLELMDQMGLTKVDLIGCSIGGWISTEMLTKAPERFGKVVLVAPVGIKTGPWDKLDIPDIFVMPPTEVPKMMFHDPAKMAVDPAKLTDDQLAIQARNRETLALLVWEPYMHNPKLTHRLQRVSSPTLFVRGASDGLVSAAYLENYAKFVKGAKTATIPEAGHAPHLEQPEAFTRVVVDFLGH
jgi:pimeloyl-ACP methyl ester carboxylesterase